MHFTKLFQIASNGSLADYAKIAKRLKTTNPRNNKGNTPLHVAAASGQLAIFEYIFRKARTIKEQCPQNIEGITPFHMAALNGHITRLLEFLADPMHSSRLFILANYGSLTNYITIAERQEIVNPKDEKDGTTPLHLAAESGQLAIFEYIFQKIEVKCPETNEGITPFHLAAKNGHFAICELIITNPHVTNKNPKDPTWKTPFHWAAENGFLNICHLIILYTDDKNPGNLMGITPLHVAASKGHLSICQLIIENIGEDKNPRELRRNNTPFHFAALNGHASVCQLFLDHIDNPQPTNSYGDTPFQWALEHRKLEVCELILQHIGNMVYNETLHSEEFLIQKVL